MGKENDFKSESPVELKNLNMHLPNGDDSC
jgi:hypothetical protein